jgi:hypothetical protein
MAGRTIIVDGANLFLILARSTISPAKLCFLSHGVAR